MLKFIRQRELMMGVSAMSVETRHTEKSILFSLLCVENIEDVKRVISHLIATMEPEDVELVKAQIAELKESLGLARK